MILNPCQRHHCHNHHHLHHHGCSDLEALKNSQNPFSHLTVTRALRFRWVCIVLQLQSKTVRLREVRRLSKGTEQMSEELRFHLWSYDSHSVRLLSLLLPPSLQSPCMSRNPYFRVWLPSGISNSDSFLWHSSQFPTWSPLLSLKTFLQRLLQLLRKSTS